MSELLKLAERCEAASGPDRELDDCISEAINERWENEWGDLCDFNRKLIRSSHWTASPDAAMSLVPEGWSYTIAWLHRNSRATAALFHARLDEQRADAATPALSLCAAALRARAQEPQP